MIKCEDIEKCCSESSDKRKTLKDKKGGSSRLLIENKLQKKFNIIDFEDCVYKAKQQETKCDFGILTDTEIIYVELKGSDVKQGIFQLKSTIEDTKQCFKDLNFKGNIVVTKFSKPNLVKQRKDYKDLVKLLQKEPVIKQNIHTENI
ncbi:hypothetical protein [Chryseobacterium gambrini]|jgi:hypothetical protein|uniref:Uncharacterized protein n=1 Tax=Chryseobacterium gambrini TaxID=373672 RepID=A0ABN7CDY3_9FLAO|nr:hypothetical protein CRDW_19920 [Chryseobacterium gambrini]